MQAGVRGSPGRGGSVLQQPRWDVCLFRAVSHQHLAHATVHRAQPSHLHGLGMGGCHGGRRPASWAGQYSKVKARDPLPDLGSGRACHCPSSCSCNREQLRSEMRGKAWRSSPEGRTCDGELGHTQRESKEETAAEGSGG